MTTAEAFALLLTHLAERCDAPLAAMRPRDVLQAIRQVWLTTSSDKLRKAAQYIVQRPDNTNRAWLRTNREAVRRIAQDAGSAFIVVPARLAAECERFQYGQAVAIAEKLGRAGQSHIVARVVGDAA